MTDPVLALQRSQYFYCKASVMDCENDELEQLVGSLAALRNRHPNDPTICKNSQEIDEMLQRCRKEEISEYTSECDAYATHSDCAPIVAKDASAKPTDPKQFDYPGRSVVRGISWLYCSVIGCRN